LNHAIANLETAHRRSLKVAGAALLMDNVP